MSEGESECIQYLGDGAYAWCAFGSIKLYCERGGVNHAVYLERSEMLRAIKHALKCGVICLDDLRSIRLDGPIVGNSFDLDRVTVDDPCKSKDGGA